MAERIGIRGKSEGRTRVRGMADRPKLGESVEEDLQDL